MVSGTVSAIVVPVKIHQEVIGLLVVVRKADRAFEGTVQSLLEAVADYASISLVNTHLFRALQEGADNAQADERKLEEQLQEFQQKMQSVLQSATYPIDLLLTGKMGKLSSEQKKALETAQSALKRAGQLFTPGRPSPSNGSPQ